MIQGDYSRGEFFSQETPHKNNKPSKMGKKCKRPLVILWLENIHVTNMDFKFKTWYSAADIYHMFEFKNELSIHGFVRIMSKICIEGNNIGLKVKVVKTNRNTLTFYWLEKKVQNCTSNSDMISLCQLSDRNSDQNSDRIQAEYMQNKVQEGVDINNVTFTEPTETCISDACEFGMGGYNMRGIAWR